MGLGRSTAHAVRVEKLVALVRRRAGVEREMVASAKRVESALRAAGRELGGVLEARVEGGEGG